jgi:hypothetical protein
MSQIKWVVGAIGVLLTAQSVAAGQVVDCDTEVTLSAKKTGE